MSKELFREFASVASKLLKEGSDDDNVSDGTGGAHSDKYRDLSNFEADAYARGMNVILDPAWDTHDYSKLSYYAVKGKDIHGSYTKADNFGTIHDQPIGRLKESKAILYSEEFKVGDNVIVKGNGRPGIITKDEGETVIVKYTGDSKYSSNTSSEDRVHKYDLKYSE